METPQLSYRIHPSVLNTAIRILNAESISFEMNYEVVYGFIYSFTLKMEKVLEHETNIAVMKSLEAASLLQLSQEENRMKHLADIDWDYEMIKSDMKALIFYARLNQSDDKLKRKENFVTDMLHSKLSKNLRPASGRSSTK